MIKIIQALGVCIEKNARKHIIGKINHKFKFVFFIAMHNTKIDIKDKIQECRQANGVPDTG